MENHEHGDVMASSSASFQRSMARRGRDYTQYFAVAHPSLPNYLAIASGSTAGKTTDDITAGELSGSTVWDQLTAAHISWGVFEETMPSPCYAPYSAGSFPADYALKHNPAVPFGSVFSDPGKCARVQPLTQMDPRHLPTVSFITPNECNDGHSCPLSVADAWLADQVPPLVQAGADVVVTYDEGTTDLGVTGSGGGNVFAAEIGPGVPAGSVVATPVDHYSLLAGIEARCGLPALGKASGATPLPL
jgi:acid phosphatase